MRSLVPLFRRSFFFSLCGDGAYLLAVSLALHVIIKLSKKRLRLTLGHRHYHGSFVHHVTVMNHLGITQP